LRLEIMVSSLPSTTLSVRVDSADEARLEALSRSTGRSRSVLAAEAISEYLSIAEWQIAATKRAMESLDRGERIAHGAVKDWVASWDGGDEMASPKPSAG
jgi:RHH-type rel operon transcriptional repressor/antitoxin RelB